MNAYEKWNLWITGGGVLLALFGLAALFKQIKQTDRNMRLDQRAWVGAHTVTGKGVGGESIRVEVRFVNTGKTPAKEVHGDLTIEYFPAGEEPRFRNDEAKAVGRQAVSPNSEYRWTSIRAFSNQEVADVKAAKTILYIGGTIWYRDIFDSAHRTLVCQQLNPVSESWASCRTHDNME